MDLKEYKPPLREAASKIKALASRGFRGSKANEDEGANKAPVALWVELWIEKPQITTPIVRYA